MEDDGHPAGSPKEIDFDQALLDPSTVFSRPSMVVEHAGLSREQKIEILRRWAYDESEIAVADEEGMPDGKPLVLDEVLLALERLGVDIDQSRRPPTKQGGI